MDDKICANCERQAAQLYAVHCASTHRDWEESWCYECARDEAQFAPEDFIAFLEE